MFIVTYSVFSLNILLSTLLVRVALTFTIYSLSPLLSLGISKSRAFLNTNLLPDTISNNAPSSPPVILHDTSLSEVSVTTSVKFSSILNVSLVFI